MGPQLSSMYRPSSSSLYTLVEEKDEDAPCCAACGQSLSPESSPSSSTLHLSKSRSCRLSLRSLLVRILGAVFTLLVLGGLVLLVFLDREDYCHNHDLYPADKVFGRIPVKEVVFQESRLFNYSDPFEGRWDGGLDVLSGKQRTVWDGLYLSPYIEIPNPSMAQASDGIPLKKFSGHEAWTEQSQGFVPSMLHQIHCVGVLKHHLLRFEHGDFSQSPYEDTSHCLEYLRQTIMCHGDLTLEPPLYVTDTTFAGPTGWGITHRCRDWDYIHDFITEHMVTFADDGSPIPWKSM